MNSLAENIEWIELRLLAADRDVRNADLGMHMQPERNWLPHYLRLVAERDALAREWRKARIALTSAELGDLSGERPLDWSYSAIDEYARPSASQTTIADKCAALALRSAS